MRCDEIRDRFVELLYDETGTPGPDRDLQAHIESCSACRRELDSLKKVRVALQSWKDEAPIRPVLLPAPALNARAARIPAWARYAAVAAALMLAFLAGFSYRAVSHDSDHYTRAETRELIKQVSYDLEARMSQNMDVQLQKALDTVENEQGYMYATLMTAKSGRERNKN